VLVAHRYATCSSKAMTAIPAAQNLDAMPRVGQRTVRWYLHRVCNEPTRAVVVLLALLRGQWYKRYYRLRGLRFRAGSNFRVFGGLHVRGPGEVVFGDNIVVGQKATPWTYDPAARIVIGDDVMMEGTKFRCLREIVIGKDCILGEATITDSDFLGVPHGRRSDCAPVRTAPVHVAENVWITPGAAILAGTRIGKNSVVGCLAVCTRDYPENVIIMGNPAKPIAPISGG
jgi:acetyltransferase-like isoleucine patch superfamily enzyme